MQVGEFWVEIGVNMDHLKKSMSEAQGRISNMAADTERKLGPVMDKIGKAFKVVGTAAVAGFSAATVGAVKGAASLEGYRNTLNVVMKDQKKAAETMAWAVDFANKTPFETDSIVEATVRLQSYGLEAQKVLPAIGDMAGVMNKDIMQAVEAVADAQTGELERLKEFGITKQMIIDQANKTMRDKQVVNNQGQITDQEAFNKALFDLMNERFKGGMEIQANSFTGLMSTIKGVFSTTLATMAGISETGEVKIGGLFDTLKKKMQQVIDKINEWQENGQLQEWSDQIGAALSTFFTIAEKVFGFLVDVAKGIYEHWNLIGPVLTGVLASFMAYQAVVGVLKAVALAQTALNLAMSLNPIGMVIIGIGVLVAAGLLLVKNWDTIKAKASELWKHITDVWEGIKKKTSEIWDNIKKYLVEWWPYLLGVLLGPMGLVAAAIYDNWDAIKQFTVEVWTTISTWLSNLWAKIENTVKTAWNNIYKHLAGIWTNISEGFDNLVKKALDWGKNLMGEFINGFKSRFEDLKAALKSAADAVSGFLGFHSPTKLGPGRDADKWAPNFVKMFAAGIKSNLPLLQDSLNSMVQVMDLGKLRFSIASVNTVTPSNIGSYITNNSSNSTYAPVININVSGGSSREQAEDIMRELHRLGVRF